MNDFNNPFDALTERQRRHANNILAKCVMDYVERYRFISCESLYEEAQRIADMVRNDFPESEDAAHPFDIFVYGKEVAQ
jgi:hypothetical protein